MPVPTTVAVPRPVVYSQKSIVTPPPVTPITVPTTATYTQKSIVPPPAPIIPVPTTSPVSIPKPVVYGQNSIVPPPVPIRTSLVSSVAKPVGIPLPSPTVPITTRPLTTGLAVPLGVKSTVPLGVSTLPVKSIIGSPVIPKPISPSPVQPLVTMPATNIPPRPIVNGNIITPSLGMNRPFVYNASTYKPITYGRTLPAYNGLSGYRTTSIGSVGSYGGVGNMNSPIQYASKTYNARKL